VRKTLALPFTLLSACGCLMHSLLMSVISLTQVCQSKLNGLKCALKSCFLGPRAHHHPMPHTTSQATVFALLAYTLGLHALLAPDPSFPSNLGLFILNTIALRLVHISLSCSLSTRTHTSLSPSGRKTIIRQPQARKNCTYKKRPHSRKSPSPSSGQTSVTTQTCTTHVVPSNVNQTVPTAHIISSPSNEHRIPPPHKPTIPSESQTLNIGVIYRPKKCTPKLVKRWISFLNNSALNILIMTHSDAFDPAALCSQPKSLWSSHHFAPPTNAQHSTDIPGGITILIREHCASLSPLYLNDSYSAGVFHLHKDALDCIVTVLGTSHTSFPTHSYFHNLLNHTPIIIL
jgi:hypothetical protein